MEFKHTLEILHRQTEEISRITDKLKSEKEIRQIDIDLLLEKLRDIYDLATDLKSTIRPEESTIRPEELATRPEEAIPEEEVVAPEEQLDPVFEIENRLEVEEETVVEKGISGSDSELVSDRFKTSKRILNEEMSEKNKTADISAQYKTSPISSITGGLGLNDRFELINELFGGDKVMFDKTVEILNMAGSFVEAYNYLEENFDWDMDNIYVQRILELIRRKLIVRRNEQ